MSILPVSAVAPADSVSVYFRIGQSRFDAAYDNNGFYMDAFIERLSMSPDSVESVVVRGYVSPEGHDINDRLSQKRCDKVAEYIIRQTGISPDIVKMEYAGLDWGMLRQYVSETPDMPSREEILEVIDNVPVWIYDAKGKIVDGRNKRLMEVSGGHPYRWMRSNLFPKLRKVVAVATYFSAPQPTVCPEPTISPECVLSPEYKDSHEGLRDSGNTDSMDSIAPPNQFSDLQGVIISEEATGIVLPAKDHKFIMAVKTNMLYDLALVPNIAAEFYLGKNLSVYGEWMYAWWDSYNRHRYWRIYGGDLGLRWWFGGKAHEKALTGHHLGIWGGALTFDFELGDHGYMGGKPGGTLWDRCLVNSGIEYGYSMAIGSRLNIDFSVSLGYMGGKYIKYFPFDNDYYREKEYRMRYFGPTKAEISLVWLIGRGNVNKRKGGDR